MTAPPDFRAGHDPTQEICGSSRRFRAITKSDTQDLEAVTVAIYVGTGGDIQVSGVDDPDNPAIFPDVPNGFELHVRATRVWSTNTTASGMVAMF